MEKQKPWPIGPQKDINIEGAIKYMKEMRSICDTDDGFVPQVYDMAIAALRRAAPENKPLTYRIKFTEDEITEFKHNLNAVKNNQLLDSRIRISVFKLLHKFPSTHVRKPEGGAES